MSREDLQRFWLEVYVATVDEIPQHPTTTGEIRRAEQAKRVLSTWANNFDRDRSKMGGSASAWTALNAVTEWFDHQRPTRATSESARQDNRTFSKLWGTAAEAKQISLQLVVGR